MKEGKRQPERKEKNQMHLADTSYRALPDSSAGLYRSFRNDRDGLRQFCFETSSGLLLTFKVSVDLFCTARLLLLGSSVSETFVACCKFQRMTLNMEPRTCQHEARG